MTVPASLNYKEIDVLLTELALPGCRIQEIAQPRPEYLVFELFGRKQRFNLLMVCKPGYCRMHRFSGELGKGGKPQRFVSFLRAHVRNGYIQDAHQIDGERIVNIEVVSGSETVLLWLRLWSAAPNLIVTDKQGTILDAMFRRPARGEISGGHFSLQTALAKKKSSPQKEYRVRDFPGQGDLNARVETYFSAIERNENLEKLKAALRNRLTQMENRLLLKLENIKTRSIYTADYEHYKEAGDLIMGALHSLHKGEKNLHIADYYHGNTPIDIPLKTELSPTENAEEYYRKYKKAKQEYLRLQTDQADTEQELEHIRARLSDVLTGDDPQKLRELMKKTKGTSRAKKNINSPGLRFMSNGFTIFVGRSSKENELLLRKKMRGNDYWLHCRDYPGSYVFIKSIRGKSIPLETLLDAGNLALAYSKARSSDKINVYYTQVKYLKKIKGGKPGLVIPTQEKNLFISKDSARLKRLRDSLKLDIEN